MKGELKAGGLALIVSSTIPEEIGRCVTLSKLVQPQSRFITPDGDAGRWSYSHAAWLVVGNVSTDSRSGGHQRNGWAMYYPSSLMPIDGDDHQERDQLAKDKPVELTA